MWLADIFTLSAFGLTDCEVPLAPSSALNAYASAHIACSTACVDGTTYESVACAAGVDRTCTGLLADFMGSWGEIWMCGLLIWQFGRSSRCHLLLLQL